ncbi:vacuolar protein sorting-associated protein 37C-like [Athalia rosae]|uniref:vacuolar protein sorting-associated protein 37C-like n=1 Tax=Athalia rosae TaxID=37344 RepID=UPI0020346337|nr:vacuolar protein sorting-associated protein 37C-like [Athalia rosae]
MKFLIVSFALAAIASAQYQPGYTEPLPGKPQIAILRQLNDQSAEGNYQWHFETENGIKAGETGTRSAAVGPDGEGGLDIQGEYSYTSPEGVVIHTTYRSGPFGYVAEGDHIPKTPDYILRSLEWNAAHPEESKGDYNPDYNRKTNPYYPGQPGVHPVPVYKPVQPVKPIAKDAAKEEKKEEAGTSGAVPSKPSVLPAKPFYPGGFVPGVNPGFPGPAPGYYGPQPGFPGAPGYPQPAGYYPGQPGYPQPLAYQQPGFYQRRP